MIINGQPFPLNDEVMTLAGLLETAGFDPDRVAVMRNGRIVPRNDFEQMTPADDDVLEVVAFVGGG